MKIYVNSSESPIQSMRAKYQGFTYEMSITIYKVIATNAITAEMSPLVFFIALTSVNSVYIATLRLFIINVFFSREKVL